MASVAFRTSIFGGLHGDCLGVSGALLHTCTSVSSVKFILAAYTYYPGTR
jgi:hypothetical protein